MAHSRWHSRQHDLRPEITRLQLLPYFGIALAYRYGMGACHENRARRITWKLGLDLSDLTKIHQRSCADGSYYSSTQFSGQVFTHGDHAFVPRTTYESGRDAQGRWFSEQQMLIEIVDLSSQPPRVTGEIALDPTGASQDGSQASYYGGFVQTERALMVGRREGYYRYDPDTGEREEPTISYDIIDLRDGADASVVTRVQVPSALSWGGFGYGVAGCMIDVGWGFWGYGGYDNLALVSGNVVASQHEEALDDGSGRVRYYLDRIDLSDPSSPEFLEPINIPGQLLRYDHMRGRVVTLDYLPEVIEEAQDDPRGCYERGSGAQFQYSSGDRGICVRWKRRLNSLLLEGDLARRVSLLELDATAGRSPRQVAVTDSRIFYQRWSFDDEGYQLVDPEVVSLGYALDGRLSEIDVVEPELKIPYGNMVARDERLMLFGNGTMEVIDSPSGAPLDSALFELRGWGCSGGTIELVDDQFYCAMGMYGVQHIDLEP